MKPVIVHEDAIARPNGTFLGIRVVDNVWRLTFYDKKRKPMAPDVNRAALRWPGDASSVAEARPEDAATLGRMLAASGKIASLVGVAESGYRLVINNGPDAGESVPHLHIHWVHRSAP